MKNPGKYLPLLSKENTIWYHTVGPLTAKKRREFGTSVAKIGARVAERDKPRVSVPMVGVQARRRLGESAEDVVFQNIFSRLNKRFCCGQYEVRW